MKAVARLQRNLPKHSIPVGLSRVRNLMHPRTHRGGQEFDIIVNLHREGVPARRRPFREVVAMRGREAITGPHKLSVRKQPHDLGASDTEKDTLPRPIFRDVNLPRVGCRSVVLIAPVPFFQRDRFVFCAEMVLVQSPRKFGKQDWCGA